MLMRERRERGREGERQERRKRGRGRERFVAAEDKNDNNWGSNLKKKLKMQEVIPVLTCQLQSEGLFCHCQITKSLPDLSQHPCKRSWRWVLLTMYILAPLLPTVPTVASSVAQKVADYCKRFFHCASNCAVFRQKTFFQDVDNPSPTFSPRALLSIHFLSF